MFIKLNNKQCEVSEFKLISILKSNNLYHDRGIAISINDEVFPRNDWEQYQVKENDNILIITATQGG